MEDNIPKKESQTTRHVSGQGIAGRKRRGIVFYLRVGLLGLSGLAIVSILLSLIAFQLISAQLEKTTRETIPTILQANRLMDLVRSIDSEARNLPHLDQPFAIGKTSYNLMLLTNQLKTAVNELDPDIVGKEALERAHNSLEAMDKQLAVLHDFVETRAQARIRGDELVLSLEGLYSQIDKLDRMMKKLDGIPPEWAGVVVRMLQSTELLVSSLATQDPAVVMAKQAAYSLELTELAEAIPRDRPELRRPALDILMSMTEQRELFDEQFLQMRLDVRVNNAIKGLAIMDRLVQHIGNISDTLNRLARQKTDETTRMIQHLGMVLIGLSVVCVAGLMLIMLYINRRLVIRMKDLQVGMLSHVSGTPNPISIEGTDEISDMARSFMFYVEEVGRREKSLQERTRELDEALADLTVSERRFQTIAANVPGAIFQAAVTGGGKLSFLYISPGVKEHFGVSPDMLTSGSDSLEIHPEDRDAFQEALSRLPEQGDNFEFIGRLSPERHGRMWVRITAKITHDQGRDVLLNGLLLNVTSRKLAELEYLASQRTLSAMSQAVDDALVMIDGRGLVMFWNQAAERLFGYTADEAVGLEFHVIATPPEMHEKAREGIKRFAESGEGTVFESNLETNAVNRQGEYFPVEISLSSFQVDDEWFAVGTVRDITERMKAQRELEESEERVRTIVNSVNVGIVLIDPESKTIADANPVATQMIGADLEQIIGSDCHRSICTVEKDECPFLDQGMRNENIESEIMTFGGEKIPVLKTVASVVLRGKQFLLESFVDLTERKKAEEEVRQYLEDLERFNKLVIGREEKMIQLKEEINDLLVGMGRGPKYRIVE